MKSRKSMFYTDDQGRVRYIGGKDKKARGTAQIRDVQIAPMRQKAGYFFTNAEGRVVFTGGPGAGGGGTSAVQQGDTIGPPPKPFSSLAEAKEWAKEWGINLDELDDVPEDFSSQVTAALRDVQDKVPVPLAASIYVSSSYTEQYDESSRTITLTTRPPRSHQNTVDYLENELSMLSENSPRRLTVQKQLDVLRDGSLSTYHSQYHFPQSRHVESVIRHEAGHGFHQLYRGGNIYGDPGIDTLQKKYPNWRETFGITLRGMDTWGECVAENFVFWSMGKTQYMHPEMVSTFDTLVRIKQ